MQHDEPIEIILLKSGNRSFALTLDNTQGAEDVVHSIDLEGSPARRKPPRKPLHLVNQKIETKRTGRPPRAKKRVQSNAKRKQPPVKPEPKVGGRGNGGHSPPSRKEQASENSPRFGYSDETSLLTHKSNSTEESLTATGSETATSDVGCTQNESGSDATNKSPLPSPLSMKTISIDSPLNDSYISSDDSQNSAEMASHGGEPDDLSEKELPPAPENQASPPRRVIVPLLSRNLRRNKNLNSPNTSDSRDSLTPSAQLRAQSPHFTLKERPLKPTSLQLREAKATLNHSPRADASIETSNDHGGSMEEQNATYLHSLTLKAAKEAVSAMKSEGSINDAIDSHLRALQAAKEALSPQKTNFVLGQDAAAREAKPSSGEAKFTQENHLEAVQKNAKSSEERGFVEGLEKQDEPRNFHVIISDPWDSSNFDSNPKEVPDMKIPSQSYVMEDVPRQTNDKEVLFEDVVAPAASQEQPKEMTSIQKKSAEKFRSEYVVENLISTEPKNVTGMLFEIKAKGSKDVPPQKLSKTLSEDTSIISEERLSDGSQDKKDDPYQRSSEESIHGSNFPANPSIPLYIPVEDNSEFFQKDDNDSFHSKLSLDSAIKEKHKKYSSSMKPTGLSDRTPKKNQLKSSAFSNYYPSPLSMSSLRTINLSYAEEEKENNSVSSSKVGKKLKEKTIRKPLGGVPISKSRDTETIQSAENCTKATISDQPHLFLKEHAHSTNHQSLAKCDSEASTEPITNITFAKLASSVLNAHSTKQQGDRKVGNKLKEKTIRKPLGDVPISKPRATETSQSAENCTKATLKEHTHSTNHQSLAKCDSEASTEPITNITFAKLASSVLNAQSAKQQGGVAQHQKTNMETLLAKNRIGESSIGLIEKFQQVGTLRLFVDEYIGSDYWSMLNSLYFNEQIRKIVVFRRRRTDRMRVRSPEELGCFFHVLQRLTSLFELHLWNFEPDDRPVLTRGLANHASLEYVQLHFGTGTLDKSLTNALSTLPKLISLEVEVSESFPVARLLEAKQLGVLSILCAEKSTPFEFTSSEIVDLANSLRGNQSLCVLDLEPIISVQDALPAIMEVLRADNRSLETFQFSCVTESESDGDLAMEKVLGAMEANPGIRVLWNNNYESWTVSTEMQKKVLESLRGHASIQQFHVFLEDANYWYKKNNILERNSDVS